MTNDLLEFAEYMANHRSSNMHGMHSEAVAHARRIVKAHGGRLDKIGRYEEGSAVWKPFEKFIGGKWVYPKLNRETDQWEFPSN